MQTRYGKNATARGALAPLKKMRQLNDAQRLIVASFARKRIGLPDTDKDGLALNGPPLPCAHRFPFMMTSRLRFTLVQSLLRARETVPHSRLVGLGFFRHKTSSSIGRNRAIPCHDGPPLGNVLLRSESNCLGREAGSA